MLQNVFYLGRTKCKEQTFPCEYEPLINRELFDRCQEVRRQRGPKSRSLGSKQRVYMLSGLATCHVCGLTLRCQASENGRQYRYYRHTAVDRGHACTAPSKMIRATIIEEQWSDIVCRIRLPKDWQQRVEELVGDADERASMLREQASIEEKLQRLAQLYQDRIIDDDDYISARDSLQRRHAMLAIPDTNEVIEAADYLRDLDKLWDAATPTEKQGLSRVLVGIIAVDVVNEAVVGLHPQRPFAVLLREVCGEKLVLDNAWPRA